MVPRSRKISPPKCPHCHEEVAVCPGCGLDMRGTEEKGVDVRIATDMIRISLALDRHDDIGRHQHRAEVVPVLVSPDSDFVPLAEFLAEREIKVIHGWFPLQGAKFAEACWEKIDILELRENFRREPAER